MYNNNYIFRNFVFMLLILRSAEAAYLKSQCGFSSTHYSVEWAFEPQTRNIVFVLRMDAPKNVSGKALSLNGLGLEHKQGKVDFTGVSVQNNGLMKTVTGKSNAEGQIMLSPNSAVKGISMKKVSSGDIIAEFAQSFEFADLFQDDCLNLYFPTQWMEISEEKPSFTMSTAQQKRVCAITEKCRLDPNALEASAEEQKHRDVPVKFAKSVDISGKGDPCSFKSELYDVKWSYNRGSKLVDFVLKQKPKMGLWWTAIGIGDNMSDMDVGVIFLKNGVPEAMKDYFSSSYDAPELDSSQDWKFDKKLSKWDDGEVELHFSRKVVTNDTEKDRTLDGCVLFQFAVNSGTYGDGNRIHKHEEWPDLYKACDLKRHCARQKRSELPEISHYTDITNGSQKEIVNEPKRNQTGNDINGDRVISLLMKSLGPKIVQTVAESEEESRKNSSEVTQMKKGQEEALPNGVNGKSEYKLEKKQESAETKTGSANGITEGISQPTTGTQKSEVQPSGGGGSPFSLNAFIGNQTEENNNLTPVGEPTANAEKIGEKTAPATNNSGDNTTVPARFGISQVLGDGESAEGSDQMVESTTGEIRNETGGAVTLAATTENSTVPVELTTNVSNSAEEKEESGVNGTYTNSTVPSSNGVGSANATEVTEEEEEKQSTSHVPVADERTTEGTTHLPANSSELTESDAPNNTVSMEPSTAVSTTPTTTLTTKLSPNTTTTILDSEQQKTTENNKFYSTQTTQGHRENTDKKEEESHAKANQSITPSGEHTTITVPSENGEAEEDRNNAPPEKSSKEEIKLPVSRSKCDVLRPDLPICRGYMDNYMSKVKEWADKHGEQMENQFEKACKLLSAVPHVPTLCCQIFADRCTGHI